MTIVQVSNSQRRALVDYSYVPPSTSAPSRNTPSQVPESSLNQISKFATVSSFPRIDPSEVIEKKKEILNSRQPNTAKGDFAARPRNNKTGDLEPRQTVPSDDIERKSNDDDEDVNPPESSYLAKEDNTDKSLEANLKRGSQHEEKQNSTSMPKSSIRSTRVMKTDFGTKSLNEHGSSTEDISPSAVLKSEIPVSRSPSYINSKDNLTNIDERNKDDSERDQNKNGKENAPKGIVRNASSSQAPSSDGMRIRGDDRDDRLSYSNSRRSEDVDKYNDRRDGYRDRVAYDDRDRRYPVRVPYDDRDRRYRDRVPYDDSDDRYRDRVSYDDRNDTYRDRIPYDDRDDRYRDRIPYDDRDDRYRDRIPYDDRDDRYHDRIPYDDKDDRYRVRIPYDDSDDRKKEDTKHRNTATINNRNRDGISDEDKFAEDRRDRRRGDEGKYEHKTVDYRYHERKPTDQRYQEERRRDSDRYDNQRRRLDRDRASTSYDDKYLERYPNVESRSRYDSEDRATREHRYRDRLPDEEIRSVKYHNENRGREYSEETDDGYSKESRNNDNGRYPKERNNGRLPESRSNDKLPESRRDERIPENKYRDETRRRYDDDRPGDYDRKRVNDNDEYRYRDRFRDDKADLNHTRSKVDDRYNNQNKNVDSSRYDSEEDPYRSYSNSEHSRSKTRGIVRDTLLSSRTDYRPSLEETRFTRQDEITGNERRYPSSSSRSYIGSDLKRNVGNDDRDRRFFDDESKFHRIDEMDKIAPSRVRDDSLARGSNRETYDQYEGRKDGYRDDRHAETIDTDHQNKDDRLRTPSHTRIESSRDSSNEKRKYYPTDEVRNFPSKNDEYSERRLYSSEEDYRFSNIPKTSGTNLPDSTLYDERRRDYRSDDSNKEYADEEERNRRLNARNRDSIPKVDEDRYQRTGSKDDRFRDVSGRDEYYRDKDETINTNQRNREEDRFNRRRENTDDRKYEEDKYDRNRYNARNEDRRIQDRDGYDYRYRNDQSRARYDDEKYENDRYDDDRYESDRYDRNRDRNNESRYNRNRDKYDESDYETRRFDRNSDSYDDDRYSEDKYDRPAEQRPRDDRIRSLHSPAIRSGNNSPSRSDTQKGNSSLSSSASKDPFYPGIGDQEIRSKDVSRQNTSISFSSDYETDRPLSAKEVIDAALRQTENAEMNPKKIYYPVFDPRISNLTSPDIIRPSERRGTTINSRRRRRREISI